MLCFRLETYSEAANVIQVLSDIFPSPVNKYYDALHNPVPGPRVSLVAKESI